MTKYQLACDKRITIVAIALEVLTAITFILLCDTLAQNYLEIHTPFVQHVPAGVAVAILLTLQYLILITELIARHRDDRSGLTLPVALIPGGTLARSILMAAATVPVILLKFLVYFVSVVVAFILQLIRLDRLPGVSAVTDATDHLLEPFEVGVNRLYNLLFFHKIQPNSSVFTSFFNCSLGFWCINH